MGIQFNSHEMRRGSIRTRGERQHTENLVLTVTRAYLAEEEVKLVKVDKDR